MDREKYYQLILNSTSFQTFLDPTLSYNTLLPRESKACFYVQKNKTE